MSKAKPYDVIIADNFPIALMGLQRIIDADGAFAVIGAFEDGREALEALRTRAPHLAIIDQTMPGLNGLDLLRAARKEGLPTRTVLLTGRSNERIIYDAACLGVHGILFNDDPPPIVRHCMIEVAEGRQWLTRAATDAIARETARRDNARSFFNRLTEREVQVARLVCTGLSNKSIAGRLGLSEGTVKIHLNNIFRKGGRNGRSELVNVAKDFDEFESSRKGVA